MSEQHALRFLYVGLLFCARQCLTMHNPLLRTPSSNEQHMERLEELLQYVVKQKEMASKQKELAGQLQHHCDALQRRWEPSWEAMVEPRLGGDGGAQAGRRWWSPAGRRW